MLGRKSVETIRLSKFDRTDPETGQVFNLTDRPRPATEREAILERIRPPILSPEKYWEMVESTDDPDMRQEYLTYID